MLVHRWLVGGLTVAVFLGGRVPSLAAQDVAAYLSDLKQHPVTEASVARFLKGIEAEKQANARALAALGSGRPGGTGAIGGLLDCLPKEGQPVDMAKMGQCGGGLASDSSAQQRASGLEDDVFEGMKQRLWIYFDGTATERRAQFTPAELAVLTKHRDRLVAYRELYVNPHPEC